MRLLASSVSFVISSTRGKNKAVRKDPKNKIRMKIPRGISSPKEINIRPVNILWTKNKIDTRTICIRISSIFIRRDNLCKRKPHKGNNTVLTATGLAPKISFSIPANILKIRTQRKSKSKDPITKTAKRKSGLTLNIEKRLSNVTWDRHRITMTKRKIHFFTPPFLSFSTRLFSNGRAHCITTKTSSISERLTAGFIIA